MAAHAKLGGGEADRRRMTDISKCPGTDCDRRESCWRYTAPAKPHWQSYFFPSVHGERCEDYMPARPAKDETK